MNRKRVAAIVAFVMFLIPAAASAGSGYHYSGPWRSNRGFEGFTGTYQAAQPVGDWYGFVVTRTMLNEGGSAGWLEIGWTAPSNRSNPIVYTCGGDVHGCPGNGTPMYGKLYE
jgi:hypothetical protein